MHIALAFNLREESVQETEQSPAEPPSEPPSQPADDLYAEWDDIHTIRAVEAALASRHRVSLVNAAADPCAEFRRLRPDLVFNIAEGLNGASREAQVPAMLDYLGLPYTGSDPVTLGLCLDKQRTKEILAYHRIPTPRFTVVRSLAEVPQRLRYPLLVKPTLEGSSKGVTDKSLVFERKALLRQVDWVLSSYGQPALIEDYLPGREFTVALLGNGESLRTLPIVEIDFSTLPAGVNPIYSFEAKWLWDREEEPLKIFACPAPLEPLLQRNIEETCKRAFQRHGLPRLVPHRRAPRRPRHPQHHRTQPPSRHPAAPGAEQLLSQGGARRRPDLRRHDPQRGRSRRHAAQSGPGGVR